MVNYCMCVRVCVCAHIVAQLVVKGPRFLFDCVDVLYFILIFMLFMLPTVCSHVYIYIFILCLSM